MLPPAGGRILKQHFPDYLIGGGDDPHAALMAGREPAVPEAAVAAPPGGVADQLGIGVARNIGAVPAGKPKVDGAAVLRRVRRDGSPPFEEKQVDMHAVVTGLARIGAVR